MKLRSVITHPALLQAVLLSAAGQAGAQAWSPPIGIPMPGFGITETAPARPASWTATTPNYYYVDSSAGCSDSTNGFPGSARCTIPSSPSAGAYIEVHGTYTGSVDFSWTGTAASPIFVRGQSSATAPLITGDFTTTSGSYVIFENLHFGLGGGNIGSIYISEGAHHVVIRDSEFSGDSNRNAGGIGVGTWDYTGTAAVSNVVVKGVSIHDVGNLDPAVDQDAHCITVNGTVNNLWVVDSSTSKCSGDAIQIEAQHNRGRDKIHHIYYGRNVATGHRQSGGWIKHATDVVFSQNEVYGIMPASAFSTGQCMGSQYTPIRVWFIYNTLHDCQIGIFMASDDGDTGQPPAYVIGNLIYNIHASNPADLYNAGAISGRDGFDLWVLNNTIYNSDGGAYGPPGSTWHIHSNIIAGRSATTAAAGAEITLESPGSSVASYNLLYRSSGSVSTSLTCSNCQTLDPKFVSPSTNVFALSPGSPAIDKGAPANVATPYAAFQTLYGLSIGFDHAGAARPQGGGYDIGAFESGSTSAVKPAAPATLIAR